MGDQRQKAGGSVRRRFRAWRVRLAVSVLAGLASLAVAQVPPGWLRYAVPPDPPRYHDMPHAVVLLGNAPEEQTAADELDRGLGHMVAGTDLLLHRFDPRLDSIVLGTTDALRRARIARSMPGWTEKPLPQEGYRIVHMRRGIRQWWVLQGGSPRAELYAAFRFASLVAEDQQLPDELIETPALPLRAVDLQEDSETALQLLTPGVGKSAPDLPRLLASVAINGIVSAGTPPEIATLAAALRPFGIRVWARLPAALSDGKAAETFAASLGGVANLGGVAMETPPDASLPDLNLAQETANAAARALRRSGGTVLWQGSLGAPLRSNGDAPGAPTPEQRAAALRGHLEPNVVLTGPAVSPLLPLTGLASANFGLLPGTPQAASFDLFPEVVLPSREVVYPAAVWQRVLQTPERGLHDDATLLQVLQTAPENAGPPAANGLVHGGVVATLRPGFAAALLADPLLQANLYAFGRVAADPARSAAAITDEWARQTWGNDARVYAVAARLLLESAEAFERNSAPFGLPSLDLGKGGPDPARAARLHGAEGQPLADSSGLGIDRSGELNHYPDAFAATLADPARCPEAMLLAAHRVPYRTTMANGKTLAQNFYDAHFAGAAAAANALDAWEGTHELVGNGTLDAERYNVVHASLERAARHAELWRESTTEWLLRTSGVPDALAFVGSHPNRQEAERMQLSGFTPTRTAEPEDASGGALVTCAAESCEASTVFDHEANVYRVEIGYFDQAAGSTAYELQVNGAVQARWTAVASHAGPPGGSTGERIVVNGVRLHSGDTVAVRAMPKDGAASSLDFVEITRDPRWN